MNSITRRYYTVKPFIPRQVQIALRRAVVSIQRRLYKDVWPIDEQASEKPPQWGGWPQQSRFALVLMHDVETHAGQSKCRQLMQREADMGFRSAFNFVPERYQVSTELRVELAERGFEIGVHGLKHDGTLFQSREKFREQASRINMYLRAWEAVGFVSPSMHHNLDWMHELNIEYDASTFDSDPFEPQPDGMATIFPFLVQGRNGQDGYIELPYTLPQDFTLFVLMKEKNIEIWKRKLDWIAEKGGMALLITHPDYMNGGDGRCAIDEYPGELYEEFLEYVKRKYKGGYWQPLPREVARFWKNSIRARHDEA